MMRPNARIVGLLLATLLVPGALAAESDTERAKREMAAFCKMASLYCDKLSKKDKQAMLKRFQDGEAYRTTYPAPKYETPPAAATPGTNEYGLPTQSADPVTNAVSRMVTDCARAAGIGQTINAQQLRILTDCVDRRTGHTR